MAANSTSPGISLGSFFKYHGWLSPGVRLFRLISFPAKAAWIAVAFTIPLLLLIWQLWSFHSASLESTQKELRGLEYLQSVTTLVNHQQTLRQAAMQGNANLSELHARVVSSYKAVAERDKEIGHDLNSAAALGHVKQALDALPSSLTGATVDETFALHTAVIDAAMRLVNQVAEGAQLNLDPEPDTQNLVNLAAVMGQQELEYLTRLRDLGAAILKDKTISPARQEALLKAVALLEYLDEGYESAYRAGIEVHPDIAATMDMKGVDTTRDALNSALKKQVLSGTPSGDATAYTALGDMAYAAQAKLNQQMGARLKVLLEDRIANLHRNTWAELAAALVGVALALYLMLSFYKVMTGGLKEVAGHLQQITRGNLTTAPKPWGSDEAAQLMTTMGEMQTSLRRIASTVMDSAAGVQTASQEIASASHDLSRRTEGSAASLQQTSTNMETISANVKHTSTMVDGSTMIVSENAEAAARGKEVIQQVISNMEAIRESSNKIGEIIGVIEGIAFQTNILALNAAVEAARAGEQGRGFAVVATEVRALAGRSATAAKEIKTLISESIDRVQSGSRVVSEAGESIGVIVINADQVNALMKEISTATRDQTMGVAAVEAAVHELDQNTQQNAALVEQTASAANTLADQAQRLSQEVSFFKLG